MAPLISHQGLFTGKGLPVSFAASAKGVLNSPGSYPHFNKLVMTTGVQGEVALSQGTDSPRIVGVIVDCSPKGDTGTIETAGYEWVLWDDDNAAAVVGEIAAPSASVEGALDGPAIAGYPSAAELRAGCWLIDQVKVVGSNTFVLIRLDDRLVGQIPSP